MNQRIQSFFGSNSLSHALAILAIPVFGTAAGGQSFLYDATLNTFPTSQGWMHFSSGISEANYLLASDMLLQFSTAPDSNLQSYRTPDVSYDLATDEVVASASLQVISSGLSHPDDPEGLGFRRAGWGIEILDDAGRSAYLFVGSTGAFLLGKNSESSGVWLFDTTDGFHDYVFTVGSSGARLDIDGVQRGLLTFGQLRTDSPSGIGRMSIGDITAAQASSSRIKEFAFTVVPEPVSAAFATGVGLSAFLVWRGTRLARPLVRQG